MASLESLAIILTGFGLIASILYYTLTLQNANKTRHTQLFMEAYQKAQDQGFLQTLSEAIWVQETMDLDSWWQKYGPVNNMEFFKRWFSMLVFMEGIGIQIKRGLLDPSVVDDMMSGPILICWDRYEPIIKGIREKYGYPQFQEYQEYLVDEIRKIVNKQHSDYALQ